MTDKLTDTEMNTLRETRIFQKADAVIIERAVSNALCQKIRYEKGQVIYDKHAYQKSLGVILSGSVRVTRTTDDGHSLLVSKLGKGAVFGAAALFNDCEEYVTTLGAVRDSVILFFPQELVSWIMKRDFTVAENYIRYLSGRIRFLSDKIGGYTAGTAEKKLLRYIMDNAKPDKSGKRTMYGNMAELANTLNIGRASLYRAAESLERSGHIRKNGKIIELLEHNLYKDKIAKQENYVSPSEAGKHNA